MQKNIRIDSLEKTFIKKVCIVAVSSLSFVVFLMFIDRPYQYGWQFSLIIFSLIGGLFGFVCSSIITVSYFLARYRLIKQAIAPKQ